jgi:hypothetical protein
MTIPEIVANVRYVTDSQGEKTEVLVPLSTWEALLASWKQLSEMLEDQEDRAILQEWLNKRATGEAETVTLHDLERELIADGLVMDFNRVLLPRLQV